MRNASLCALVLATAAACTPAAGGEDDPLPDELDDGKADSLTQPTRHGAYFFDTRVTATLGGSARNHAWEFAVTGDAEVHFEGFGRDHLTASDAALYLYRKTGTSTWRRVAVDDGGAGDPVIDATLGKGTYRAILRGRVRSTQSGAALWGTCSGAGCTPAQDLCLFGAGAAAPDSYVTVSSVSETLDRETLAGLDPERDVRALQLAEAVAIASGAAQVDFAAVVASLSTRGATVREASDAAQALYALYEFTTTGGRKVAAYFHRDLGAGDFRQGAVLVDGQVASCLEPAPVCAFPARTRTLFADDEGTTRVDGTKVYATAAEVTAAAARDPFDPLVQQVLMAARVSPWNVTPDTVEAAIGKLDAVSVSELTVLGPNPRKYRMVSFTAASFAGEMVPFGFIFEAGTAAPHATVEGGRIIRCGVAVPAVKLTE